MRSLSCSIAVLISSDLFRVALAFILERRRTAYWTRGTPADLRTGLHGFAGAQVIEQLLEQLGVEVLVSILADLHDRRVGAAAEALDLLPGESAVGRQLVRMLRDALLADLDQRLGAAQHARRRPAYLEMGGLSHRGKLEHGVKRGDLERADVGHAEHIGDGADGRLSGPALLLLGAPQQRQHGRCFLAGRILADLALRPREVLRREGEAQRLLGI